MSGKEQPIGISEEERWIMETLSRAGKRAEPSEAQRAQWSALFRDTLAEARKQRGRRRAWTTAAAATILAAGAMLWVERIPEQSLPVVVANAQRVVGHVTADTAQGATRRLHQGSDLHDADRLRTGTRGGLEITLGGAVVRLDEDTVVTLNAGGLELLRGAVYVDAEPRSSARSPIVVSTRLGSVTHVGTQYVIVLDEQQLISAVREGRILVRVGANTRELSAGERTAALVRVTETGTIRQETSPRYGELWDWANAVSSGLSVAGQSPHQVLSWAARETGRVLVYADDRAAAVAGEQRLAGSRVRLTSDQVLAVVGASTRLRLDASDPAVLRVGLVSEGDDESG